MELKKKLLVIRFSAMGVVTLVSPVVHTLLDKNPDIEIVVLSKPLHEPLFSKVKGFSFRAAEVTGKHRGLAGLIRLFRELRNENFDGIIDLHSSLRSHILCFLLMFSGLKIFRIDKGRKEKKQLIRKGALNSKPLIHTTERYLEVFKRAGVGIPENELKLPVPGLSSAKAINFLKQKGEKWIGIAPFAAHYSKEWSFEKVARVAETLRNNGIKVLWFGAGKRELEILREKLYLPSVDYLVAGNFTLAEELYIMQHLDGMISMDSANMHMAAICGTRVISIWGPTHPFAGFSPLGNEEGIVQTDLLCRPCTVYGKLKNKTHQKCAEVSMEKITVEKVLEKLLLITGSLD